MSKSKKPITVHVGTLTHSHGTDVIVARSEKDFTRQLAAYCREWWKDMTAGHTGRIRKPRRNADLIDAYFAIAMNNGTETYEYRGARTI
jgi:hypothetical protein